MADVVADPQKEWPGKPEKCTELYLGSKGIEKLCGFDRFRSLEILWLNSNKLTSIHGLNTCTFLKRLYLHDNQISSLKKAFSKIRYLEVLTLHNNQLSNLDEQLVELKELEYLKYLNLFGNPLEKEEHYRDRVILALPGLEVFDRHTITSNARIAADQRLRAVKESPMPSSDISGEAVDTKKPNKEKKRSIIQREFLKEVERIRQAQNTPAPAECASPVRAREDIPALPPLPDHLDFVSKRQHSFKPTSAPLPLLEKSPVVDLSASRRASSVSPTRRRMPTTFEYPSRRSQSP